MDGSKVEEVKRCAYKTKTYRFFPKVVDGMSKGNERRNRRRRKKKDVSTLLSFLFNFISLPTPHPPYIQFLVDVVGGHVHRWENNHVATVVFGLVWFCAHAGDAHKYHCSSPALHATSITDTSVRLLYPRWCAFPLFPRPSWC